MRLHIDLLDMAGFREYTAFVDSDHPIVIERKLNEPASARITLAGMQTHLALPPIGARVRIAKQDGTTLFSGYVASQPGPEYLGYGEQASVVRVVLECSGDEFALDRNVLPPVMPMVAESAGECVRRVTEAAGLLQVGSADVADLGPAAVVEPRAESLWSDVVGMVANCARAVYGVQDDAVTLAPVAERKYTLHEGDEGFDPHSLVLVSPGEVVNDVTVVGELEPAMYVKDYFIADGRTLRFAMSQQPFLRPSITMLEEEFGGELSPLRWSVEGEVYTAAGKLVVEGAAASVALRQRLELGGALTFEHGMFTFGGGEGIVGGLYDGVALREQCICGFQVSDESGVISLRPLVQGAAVASSFVVDPSRRYVLVTRVHASEVYRVEQPMSSSSVAGLQSDVPCSVRVVLEVRDIGPADAAPTPAVSHVLFDGVVAGAPATALYGLINSTTLMCEIGYTRIRKNMVAEVRAKTTDGVERTCLVGSMSEGAECSITKEPAVYFYAAHKPAADEQIVVRYRAEGRAAARVVDEASIEATRKIGDDGRRSAVLRLIAPRARTSRDCEQAASRFLDDSTRNAWMGKYSTVSDFLPGPLVLPGDEIELDLPSRGVQVGAIVRSARYEVLDVAEERLNCELSFSNDAAEPIALKFGAMAVENLSALTAMERDEAEAVASLPNAEVVEIGSTSLVVDTGLEPPAGGGIEVRREGDWGWGESTDRNLVGRFASRAFSLPRNGRGEDYYMQMFDGEQPRKYSRYTTLLHVDVRYDSV